MFYNVPVCMWGDIVHTSHHDVVLCVYPTTFVRGKVPQVGAVQAQQVHKCHHHFGSLVTNSLLKIVELPNHLIDFCVHVLTHVLIICDEVAQVLMTVYKRDVITIQN